MNKSMVSGWRKKSVISLVACLLFFVGPFNGKIGHWSLPGITTAEAASYCAGQPDGTLCEDGSPCTLNDACAGGVCVAGPPKDCSDGNECTDDECNGSTGACVQTNSVDGMSCEDNDGNFCTGVCVAGGCGNGARPASYCLDDTACTTDTCDPATGCVHTPTAVCFTTPANNFTMLDPGGNITGGTNDVVFTWDGTCNDAVATAVVNATISSNETFFGNPWNAHDVMIYCEGGPYTVYTGCAAGDPGCGTGTNYTFTVGAGQLGGHMLFFWNGNENIDLVNIWQPGTFAGNFHKGADNGDGCAVGPCDGAKNSAAKVWDLVSTDWNGDGLPGIGFKDGPFGGFNGNFNVMKVVTDKCAGIDCSVTAMVGQCLSGACDPATGQCVYTPINEGLVCNDNNACTSGDTCVEGACTGPAKNCDDNNACTANNCNKTTGACSNPSNVTCNDSNSCTSDACTPATGACVFTPLANGTTCTQGFGGCNTGTTCQSGVCGTPKNCSDNDACTVDTCSFNICYHTPVACTDNPACVLASCDPGAGGCVFAPKACGDNNVCTDDTCEPATGACVNTNLVIDDNDACTTDSCDAVTGITHTPILCDDGSLCTIDSCDPAIGCVFTAINCDDNNACTTGDACADGVCVGTAVTCPTGQACDPADGVCKVPAGLCDDAVTRCNDGNVCTDDSCNTDTGECIHTGTPVCIYTGNNNFTMLDPGGGPVGGQQDVEFMWNGSLKTSVAASGQISNALIAANGTFFGNNWLAHDIAFYGPGTYTVYAGCPAGSPGCGAGTPITFTVGEGEIGGHMLFNWSASSDIDLVNVWIPNAVFGPSSLITMGWGYNPADKVWDMMSKDINGDNINGLPFVDGPFPLFNGNFNLMICGNCNDDDACTTDTCDKSTGICINTPIVCPGGGVCDPVAGCGKCFDAAIRCNDNNDCTTDTCIEDTGACEHTSTTASCDDGNFCTTGDLCSDGVCAGTAVVCPDDMNACTGGGVCDPATGQCSYANLPDGTSCADNDQCNGEETCQNGACTPGTAVTCPDDNNVCTGSGICDPATGACSYPAVADGTSCADNDQCNGTETCQNGACTPGTPMVCVDNNSCTMDACGPTGCFYAPVPDGTSCPEATNGTCQSGVCKPGLVCDLQNTTIKGGGQKASVDAAIQTTFSVTNVNDGGCIISYSNNSVKVKPGTNLKIDWTSSNPAVSSATLNGTPVAVGSFLQLNNVTSTNKLILDNKLMGGKDVDRITIKN